MVKSGDLGVVCRREGKIGGWEKAFFWRARDNADFGTGVNKKFQIGISVGYAEEVSGELGRIKLHTH